MESKGQNSSTTRPPFKVPPPNSSSSSISRPLLASCSSDLSQVSSSTDANEREKKRLPPIKAPVGLARSPDLTKCKSKIGSLDNIKHAPAGGRVKIETQKLQWNAKSKVGSLDNKDHKPAEARVKVETRKLDWKTSSKVQSLQNIKHKPGGGNVKIFDESYHKGKSPASGVGAHDSSACPSSATATINNKQEQATNSSMAQQNNRNTSAPGANRLAKNLKGINLLD